MSATTLHDAHDVASSVPEDSKHIRTDSNSSGLRIAVVGNVDSGKSSLVGVLCRNSLDDGRGSARSQVFRHKHEKETGRSSSVACEIMGFAGSGDTPLAVDAKASRARIWQGVHANAEKTVTFVDLCGHERYLPSTIFGLAGLLPDYALVIVGSNMGVSRMTREHIGISAALGLPLIIAVTKIDIAPPDVAKTTLEQINKTLRAARRMPFPVRTEAQAATAAAAVLTDRITPIVCISNVTGEGLTLLRKLLRLVPPRVSALASAGVMPTTAVGDGIMRKLPALAPASTSGVEHATAAPTSVAVTTPEKGGKGSAAAATSLDNLTDGASAHATAAGEATIDSVFNVPGVGVVVAGTVLRGAIRSGSTMLLGPDRVGEFQPVFVRSIHVHYTPVDSAVPGGSAAFAIRPKAHRGKGGTFAETGGKGGKWARKGMSLVDPALMPMAYWEFTAEVLILHHQTTLSVGYAPVIHTGVVAQSATITAITGLADGLPLAALRTGDRALIVARFSYRPEYLHVGDMLLFREGRAKGVGRIRSVACPRIQPAS